MGEDFAFGFRNVKIRPFYFLYLFFYLFDDEQLGGRRSPFSFTFTAISPRRNIFLLFSMSLIAVVVCQCCRFFSFFPFVIRHTPVNTIPISITLMILCVYYSRLSLPAISQFAFHFPTCTISLNDTITILRPRNTHSLRVRAGTPGSALSHSFTLARQTFIYIDRNQEHRGTIFESLPFT